MNSQNQSQSQHQKVPQQASQSVFFNDKPRATLDHSENYQFFQQNKNIISKHHIRNQPQYSEDEKYNYQNQRVNTNHHHNNWNIDQPDPFYQADLFEPYTRNEQRQTRHQPTSYNNNFQSQNPVNTQNAKSNLTTILSSTTRNIKDSNYKVFSNTKCRRITTNDYESIRYGWILNVFK